MFYSIYPTALCLKYSIFICNICSGVKSQSDGGRGERMGLIGAAVVEMEVDERSGLSSGKEGFCCGC